MPHAVTSVSNPDGLIPTSDQRLSYTSFNKTDSIIQNNYIYTLKYGHQDQRTISKLLNNGTLQKTVYYVGAFEKEVIAGIPYPKNIHYIYGGDGLAAIYTTQSSNSDMYYVHKDHLGSIDKITNSLKIVIQKTSFDAWGRRRNPDNWTYSNIPSTMFSRGYTGHEHLDQFDLINMNGRMYDPILGRFLSPDKFVQNSSNSQGYNRYSYGLNNPLLYTDPSGWKMAGMDEYWHLGAQNFEMQIGSGQHSIRRGVGGFRNEYTYSGGIYFNSEGWIVSPQEVVSNYIKPNSSPRSDIMALVSSGYSIAFAGNVYGKTTVGFINLKTYSGGGWDAALVGDNDYTVNFTFTRNSEADGYVYSLSFDFAFGGGAGFEIGYVTDKNGGGTSFISWNANIGYGISAGPSMKEIHSNPGSTFKSSDYIGYSNGFNFGIGAIGYSKGGNKYNEQWQFDGFLNYGKTYIEDSGSYSFLPRPSKSPLTIGIIWSNSNTKELF